MKTQDKFKNVGLKINVVGLNKFRFRINHPLGETLDTHGTRGFRGPIGWAHTDA